MQRLVVHALALRQLGRFHPHHFMATGYGPWLTKWCPRAMHICQLWSCTAFPAVGSLRPASCGRDSVRLAWPLHHLRFKSNKKGSAKTPQEEEEDDVDPEDSDYEDDVDENTNLPKDYKDIEKNVQSFRYDVIMKAGLDMARK